MERPQTQAAASTLGVAILAEAGGDDVFRAGGKQGFYEKTDAACAQGAASGMRMWPPSTGITVYGGIGFLSGMVGIGGGIFLAPVLHLLRWDTVRVIAGTASLFILVNSISGLAGQMSNPALVIDWQLSGLLMASVFLGGQIGSRLGAQRLRQDVVRWLTAALVIFVALRILREHLF